MQSSDCIQKMLWEIDLSLILFNTFFGIYSIPKESKYTAVHLSVNNKTQYIPLLCLFSRFMTYAPSFVRDRLSLEKAPLKLGL